MDFLRILALVPPILFGASFTPTLPGPAILPPALAHHALHGIYMTSSTVAHEMGHQLVDAFKPHGGNMVVFDVQDSAGKIAYPSTLEISQQIDNHKTQIPDLTAAVKYLHDRGYYAVARMVLFKNPYLAGKKPEWVLQNSSGSGAFVSKDGPVWLDPGNPDLRKYLADTAREIAMSGVDEVQFDYVRFPDGAKPGSMPYTYTGIKDHSRDETITGFLAEVTPEIHSFSAKVSVDIFGIVVWDNVSWKLIGQNIRALAQVVDFICPMPYPSHFGPGWGGHKNPADEPYFFVQETTKKFVEQTYPSLVKIRPWLQGFALHVNNYGPKYVQQQIKALHDIGIEDYIIWNARNVYDVSFNGFK